MYFSQTVLTGIVLQIVRAIVPGCVYINLERARGPYRYRNWKVLHVAAGPEEQAEAFAAAKIVASARHWIMVPDGHFLHGQIVGQERGMLHQGAASRPPRSRATEALRPLRR